MDQIEELWHDAKGSDVALLQSAQQFGGVQCFQIDNTRAIEQRQKEIRHLRQNVKHRQNSEQSVRRANLDYRKHRIRLADKVGVGEHDTLRISGRARGVEQSGEVVFAGTIGSKPLPPAAKIESKSPAKRIRNGGRPPVFMAWGLSIAARSLSSWSSESHDFSRRRSHHQTHVGPFDRFRRHRKMLRIAEEQGSSAIDQ